MKFYKKSNMFEDEGLDPLESPERDTFESQKELLNEESGKNGNTNTSQVIKDISAAFEQRLGSYFVANGSVGWFKYKDGKIYEVIVSPLSLGQYKDLLNPSSNSPIDKKDDLSL
jgi:hypothetical protein